MAVTVQSTASTAWASAEEVIITKPTGLVVGDLLVALVASQSGVGNISPPSGWSTIRTTNPGAGGYIQSYYKIATSTETAATNFTFSYDGVGVAMIAGGILRIDGFPAGDPVWTDNGSTTENTATPTFTNGVTPTIADSLIIMFVACERGTGTVSSYAVTTSNPSWTEAFEHTTTTSDDYIIAVAYANRTQTTDTGNSSISSTAAGTADWSSQLIVIAPSKDTTQLDTTTVTDSFLGNLSTVILETLTLTDTLSAQVNAVWTNISKTVSTWINRSK